MSITTIDRAEIILNVLLKFGYNFTLYEVTQEVVRQERGEVSLGEVGNLVKAVLELYDYNRLKKQI